MKLIFSLLFCVNTMAFDIVITYKQENHLVKKAKEILKERLPQSSYKFVKVTAKTKPVASSEALLYGHIDNELKILNIKKALSKKYRLFFRED